MANQAGLELRGAARRPAQGRRQAASRPRRTAANTGALSHYLTKSLLGLGPLLFTAAVLGVLYEGWIYREKEFIVAESGIGYWLGIIGTTMMAILLLYPLRKRGQFRSLGRVPTWFQSHMIMGIVGPLLIVLHSNFRAESLNASVAMFFMLTIVASGIIGRYLFSKIHMGLYGAKAEIKGMLADADFIKQALGEEYAGSAKLLAGLQAFENQVLVRHKSFFSSLWAFMTLGARWRSTRKHLMKDVQYAIEAEGKRRGWGWMTRRKQHKLVKRHLAIYFAAVSKAAQFGMYERMFALWHVLHMPLFFLLVLTAILHVVAVHLY
jgi:hypothetical protein